MTSMPDRNNLDWKGYEAITKYIYETLGKEFGIKIEGYGNNFKVMGKSGVKHQIDVLTSSTDGMYLYQTAIECKYWKKKINKDIVMKVSMIIEDAGINKGIIVSKSGYTRDAMNFANHSNIELVELREMKEKDLLSKPKEIVFGLVEVHNRITTFRPEILSITVDYLNNTDNNKEEVNIYSNTIRLSNGNQIPLVKYAAAFQKELHNENKVFQTITKRYEIVGGSIINIKNNVPVKIKALTFTGILKKINSNSNVNISLVDQVWLIMKSIFEERNFSISENGIIMEDKK